MLFQIYPGHLEIAEGRFGRRKVQCHDPVGRIVDIHQQGARRRPFLEPAVIAAVNLHQLAQTRTTASRLVDLRRPLPARNSQPGIRHQVPHSFLGQRVRRQLLCPPDRTIVAAQCGLFHTRDRKPVAFSRQVQTFRILTRTRPPRELKRIRVVRVRVVFQYKNEYEFTFIFDNGLL